MRLLLFLIALLLAAPVAEAQQRGERPAAAALTGRVVDAETGEPLAGASVVVERARRTDAEDPAPPQGAATGPDGTFRITALRPGAYRVVVRFIGYHERATEGVRIPPGEAEVSLGTLSLRPDAAALGEVVVDAVQERVVIRGDTTAYNADAFTVNPDASAEALVSRMPGITVEGGQVQAHGETVRRVLVDGEEFFGEDATAALRNLPAEIIQEIQVFDRQSDQARFTGFDDGEAQRTINVVTRPGARTGQFGNVYGGYGTDTRYLAGGTVNAFDGARRITVIGLANNVNQQNFSADDLMGVVGGGARPGGGRGGAGGRGGPGGRGGGNWGGGRGGPGGTGADPGTYLVGEQGGINETAAFGVNYTDRWGERTRVNASYFFNRTENLTDDSAEREYFFGEGANPLYAETLRGTSRNANHRLHGRATLTLSPSTEVVLTPRLSVQTSGAASTLFGRNTLAGVALPISELATEYTADRLAASGSTNLLVRHRLGREGRTISASLGLSLDARGGEVDQTVDGTTYDPETGTTDHEAYRQWTDSDGWGRTLSGRFAYTEPVGARGQVQLSYAPSLTAGESGQEAFRIEGEAPAVLDPALSSRLTSTNTRQRGGASYRLRGERFNATAGLDVQHERLSGDQAFPAPYTVDRTFFSVLPSAVVNLNLTEAQRLRLQYSAFTNTPSASQLHGAVDATNPLLLTRGDPDLRPSTSHTLSARFNATDRSNGQVFVGFVNVTRSLDQIATAQVFARRDTVLAGGIPLAQGAQLRYPVNLDGHWSARTFLTYGRPVPFLRSNANLSGGLSYTRAPGLLNDVPSVSDLYTVNARAFLGSNVSERVDFSLQYGIAYTRSANSVHSERDARYARHHVGAGAVLMPGAGLTLRTDFNLTHFTGLDDALQPTRALWNVGVGYRFLRNDLAEVQLSVSDLLNQSLRLDREATEFYVEDRRQQVLGRYVMLNLRYRLRNVRL